MEGVSRHGNLLVFAICCLCLGSLFGINPLGAIDASGTLDAVNAAVKSVSLRHTSALPQPAIPAFPRRLTDTHAGTAAPAADWQTGSGGSAAATHGTTATDHGNTAAGSSGSAGSKGHSGGKHISPAFHPIIFMLVAMAGSCFCIQIVNVLPDILRPPHSVVLYSFGFMLEAIAQVDTVAGTEFGIAVSGFANIDPHVIFWVFLPLLLYEDAAGANWHVVQRVLSSAILLAIPGVIVNTVLTGAYITMIDFLDFKSALLLGSILSATDPVAVVGALVALQAPAKLSSIISGEALLNDGSAVVLFQIFLEVASGRQEFEIGGAIEKLCRLAGGGVAFGLLVALFAHLWLCRTKDFRVENTLVIIAVFVSFFVAEHPTFGFSGVIATVVFGFFMSAMGKHDLQTEQEHAHHAIINYLAFLCNESIFIIAGVVGYKFSMESDFVELEDWGHLALMYIGVHLTRGTTVALAYPILHRIGYSLTGKEAAICVFGGLRGAVGLAMALIVLGDSDIAMSVRHKVCFHANGIVIGTLFINGLLITPLYKFLKIQSPDRQEHHEKLLRCLLAHGDHSTAERKCVLSEHWFFQEVIPEIIDGFVPTMASELKHAEEDRYGRKKHNRKMSVEADKAISALMEIVSKSHTRATFQERHGLFKGKHNKINVLQLSQVVKMQERHIMAQKAKLKAAKSQNVKTAVLGDSVCHKVGCGSILVADAEYCRKCGTKKLEVQQAADDLGNVDVDIDLYEPESAGTEAPKDATVAVLADPTLREAAEGAVPKRISCWISKEELKKDAVDQDHEELPVEARRTQFAWFKRASGSVSSIQEAGYTHSSMSKNKDGVPGLLIELVTAMLNSKKSAYKQMYETKAIGTAAFDFLMLSIEHQFEAMNGDLQDYKYLREELPDLFKADRVQQLKSVPLVGFLRMKSRVHKLDSSLVHFIHKIVGVQSSVLQWHLLKRNVEALLAYAVVHAQNIQELKHLKEEIFKADPESQSVTQEVSDQMDVVLSSCTELMQTLVDANPIMFIIFEHVLYARLVVVNQMQILREFCEDGAFNEDDLEHFIKNITNPALTVTRRFIPTHAHLQQGGCPYIGKYSITLDKVMKFLHWLTLEPN